MKKIIIIIVILVLVGVGGYFLLNNPSNGVIINSDGTTSLDEANTPSATSTMSKTETVIGKSVQGRDITAYHYGVTGDTEILFVGGMHGGYGWNNALVAYELMDYLKANPNLIPVNVKVTVVPVLNPDGLSKVISTTTEKFAAADVSKSTEVKNAARFNANNVDLNRNFDCDWQANAKWRTTDVSGGTQAFSEPESQAIRNYVESHDLGAVIVWYSAAGGVFSSSCHNGVLTETKNLTQTFAKASGYPAYEEFDFYEITGDMMNWLAKKEIPAISVLLTNHEETEWSKNKAGVEAVLKYFAK